MDHILALESRRMFSGFDLVLSSLATDLATVAAGRRIVGTAVVTNTGTDSSPATTTIYFALTKNDAAESPPPTNPGGPPPPPSGPPGPGGPGGPGGTGGEDNDPGVVGKFAFLQIGAVAPGQTLTLTLPLGVSSALQPDNLFFSSVVSELFIPNITPTSDVDFSPNDLNGFDNSRSTPNRIAVIRPAPSVGGGDANFGSGGTAQNTFQGPPLTVAATVFDPQTSRQYAATTRIIDNRPVLGLLRFNTDGSIDSAYGDNGVRRLPPGAPFAQARAISRLPDGAFLVVGETRDKDQVLARFSPSGEPDPSFGLNGVAVLRAEVFASLGNFSVVRVLPGLDGTTTVVANTEITGQPRRVAVVRFAGPTTDPSFGDGGFVVLRPPTSDSARAAFVLPDSRIVIVGASRTPPQSGDTTRAFITVLSSSGVPDLAFADRGTFILPPASNFESFTAVAAGPAGSLFVTGVRRIAGSSAAVPITLKLNLAGKPEKFGVKGLVVSTVPGVIIAGGASVLPTSDGGALVSLRTANDPNAVGSGRTGVSLLRLRADGTLLPTFGTAGVLTVRQPGVATAADTDSDFESFASSSEGQLEDVGGGKIRFLATQITGSSTTTFTSTQLLADGLDLSTTTTTAVSGSALIGKAGTFRITLSNQGTLAANGKFPVTIALFSDLDASGITAKTSTSALRLAPGASRTFTLKFKFPGISSVARYFVAADVNMPAGTTDVDTSNNRAAAGGSLLVGPAFTRLAFALSTPVTTLTPGATASLRLTATNAGNVPAKGAATATLFLTDDAAGTNPIEIATLPLKTTLSNLKSTAFTLRGKIPASVTAVSGKFLLVRFSGTLISLNESAEAPSVSTTSALT